MKFKLEKTLAFILIGFGILTLFLSTSVIFDLFGIREKEGNYVLFVVQANFVASLLYIVSAYGILMRKVWATKSLFLATLLLLLTFIALLFYIQNDVLYETKTIGALIFRTVLTAIFTYLSFKNFNKQKI